MTRVQVHILEEACKLLESMSACCNPPHHEAHVVGLAVMKLPRVGSTWLKKEMNALPGVHLEFEPLTDGSIRCSADFSAAVLQQLLRQPMRCVNRMSRQKACYWTKQNCSAPALFEIAGPSNVTASAISGFLIHPIYVPDLAWAAILTQPRVRLIVMRRTNLVKRTVSNMLRSSEEDSASASRNRTNTVLPAAEVVRQTRASLISFVRMPRGVNLASENAFLLLYEDLQNSRTESLGAILNWLGKPLLSRHLSSATAYTHWTKAPESLCDELSNCAHIRAAFQKAQHPCFLRQLLSVNSSAWTLPVLDGTQRNHSAVTDTLSSLAAAGELMDLGDAVVGVGGDCFPLPALQEWSCWRRSHLELVQKASINAEESRHHSKCQRLQRKLQHRRLSEVATSPSKARNSSSWRSRQNAQAAHANLVHRTVMRLDVSEQIVRFHRLVSMGVLIRLRGSVPLENVNQSSDAHVGDPGSPHNHILFGNRTMSKRRYKELLGLPQTLSGVEKVFRLPEVASQISGSPPSCISFLDVLEIGMIKSSGIGRKGNWWEGKPVRWETLAKCANLTSGAEDLTAQLPRYHLGKGSSGTELVKLNSLPRDSSLLLLKYSIPRNVDSNSLIKGFQRFTEHGSAEPVQLRRARAASAIKFIIFSRPRSASTTFISALNLHPNVSCGFEIFSQNNMAANRLRKALGFDSHADVMENIELFMHSFWSLCPSMACGFKVFPGQVRPPSGLKKLFSGVEQLTRSMNTSTGLLRVLVLERGNVTAEWESVRRAQATGNWGTSPARQRLVSAQAKKSSMKESEERLLSLEDFEVDHYEWFAHVAKLFPRAERMHVRSESIIEGGRDFSETMYRVFRFLNLPPFPGSISLPPRVADPLQV